MVRRRIVIPAYEEMMGEPRGNGSLPMQPTGDASNTSVAEAPDGAEMETEASVSAPIRVEGEKAQ